MEDGPEGLSEDFGDVGEVERSERQTFSGEKDRVSFARERRTCLERRRFLGSRGTGSMSRNRGGKRTEPYLCMYIRIPGIQC